MTHHNTIRLGLGAMALMALAAVVIALRVASDSPSASAEGPTPTKIANNGSLSGVVDILVHDGSKAVGVFYCIGKTDHEVVGTETDTTPDLIKTSLQCNIDSPGLPSGDTPPGWCEVADICNPSEPGPDAVPGPPPPPPYVVFTPSKGLGAYYHDGDDPFGLCSGNPCTVVTTCYEDLGSPDTVGPNIISRSVVLDPLTTNPSSGSTDIWFNQSNVDCKNRDPKGAATLSALPLNSYLIYDKSETSTGVGSPWRSAGVLDFDGDGCTDAEELDKTGVSGCGDDPQNPFDSFDPNTVDLTGTYHILARLSRADCGNPCADNPVPGIYIYCLADLQHDTDTDDLTMRPYCYADNPAIEINSEGYPGEFGDGFSGGPPPGPDVGGGNYVYGDVDNKHTELAGTFDTGTTDLSVAGCVLDPDGTSGTGDVWFEYDASAHQLPGTVSIYLNQSDDCDGSPSGSPVVADLWFAKQPKGKARDDDQDGVPTSRELMDDEDCGRRDPFNKNDYADMSVPRDGVIDLSNDILGVILEYAPGGYVPGTTDHTGNAVVDIYDRGGIMTNALGGHWNRMSGDGVIDLSNDILGTILQYNPGGCPPLP